MNSYIATTIKLHPDLGETLERKFLFFLNFVFGFLSLDFSRFFFLKGKMGFIFCLRLYFDHQCTPDHKIK